MIIYMAMQVGLKIPEWQSFLRMTHEMLRKACNVLLHLFWASPRNAAGVLLVVGGGWWLVHGAGCLERTDMYLFWK